MRKIIHVAIVLALAGSAHILLAQGNDLFQRALSKERAEGQLDEAIQIYERIVKEFASDRPLAARALLQMGRCYERLGRSEAQKAYGRVVQEFADQRETAADARDRLARLAAATPPVRGLSARRLWSGSEVDLEGAPSPDGRFVTFTDWETGDVAIRDLTTGAKRRLTKNPLLMQASGYAQTSAPSPDGRRVAYVWVNQATGYDLRVVGTEGGAPHVIYTNPDLAFLTFAWMPDGQRIVLASKGPDGSNRIGIVSLSEGTLRPLRSFDWRSPARLSVSPDGRYLVYDFPPREDSPNRDLFVLATDGSSGAALVEHAANDLFPIWTPDGGYVVFVSDRTGAPALWAIPVDQQAQRGRFSRSGRCCHWGSQGTARFTTAWKLAQWTSISRRSIRRLARFSVRRGRLRREWSDRTSDPTGPSTAARWPMCPTACPVGDWARGSFRFCRWTPRPSASWRSR